MAFGSLGALVEDRARSEVGLHGAERVLNLCQGRVGSPNCFCISRKFVKFDDIAAVEIAWIVWDCLLAIADRTCLAGFAVGRFECIVEVRIAVYDLFQAPFDDFSLFEGPFLYGMLQPLQIGLGFGYPFEGDGFSLFRGGPRWCTGPCLRSSSGGSSALCCR